MLLTCRGRMIGFFCKTQNFFKITNLFIGVCGKDYSKPSDTLSAIFNPCYCFQARTNILNNVRAATHNALYLLRFYRSLVLQICRYGTASRLKCAPKLEKVFLQKWFLLRIAVGAESFGPFRIRQCSESWKE